MPRLSYDRSQEISTLSCVTTRYKMSDLDTLLANFTQKGDAQVHGAIMKCVDTRGRQFQGLIVLGTLLML